MEDKLSKHTKFSKQRLDELSKQEAEAQKELFTSQRAAVEIDRRIANAKQEFALITADITQQKGYLKDQEAIVNNTIAEWNNQLTGFQAEADIISGKKRVASADFIRLEQEKEALQAEADNLENKCQELKQLYEERKLEYKGKLKLMALSIEKQQISFNEGQKAVEVRQKVLAQREEASTIKETVIRQKELDLSQRERRLQMQLNLQNM